MNQIYNHIGNFTIEKCTIGAKIKSCFELVEYTIDFKLNRITNDTNLSWEIISPLEGFKWKGATKKDDSPVEPIINNQLNGLVKVVLPLDDLIDASNQCEFRICYENKLMVEKNDENKLKRNYGIILTRSFASHCYEYNLTLDLESPFHLIKHVIPRYSFVKKRMICFSDIPSQKPISVAIVVTRKLDRLIALIIWLLAFITTALGGYYIPVWAKQYLPAIFK